MPTLPILLFVSGFVLIYSAVKDLDPRDVVKAALQGKNPGDLAGDPDQGKDLPGLLKPDSKYHRAHTPESSQVHKGDKFSTSQDPITEWYESP